MPAELISHAFIRENFPTLSQMTYLNNASTGIPPAKTVEAMKMYLEGRVTATGTFDETLMVFKNIRESLAKLLGGSIENYGTVTSTSDGLNTAAHAIDYPKESNIVISDLEFPSNYIPWQNASKWYDVDLRVAKATDGAVPTEAYLDLIDENTRIVSVSLVQFGTGYRSDVKALADAVHEVNGILVVDIIQAAGWADIDLVKMDADFAAAQAAKWLIGPIGAGFVYANKRALELMRPRFLGWWGVKNITEYGYAERELLDDAQKFQVGSLALVAHVGFLESLKTLLQIPHKKREQAALFLAHYLQERLDEIGVEYYQFGPEHESPIVSCVPSNVEEIQKRLTEKQIHCSVRNGRLRVSPHFYNTTEDIDRLIEVLRG
ncbi:MAG: aminotransferase class V-fold PLP-dependent enzyme [Candidatus Thorarchaeota archaeon]|nr:aminotransferase class V-fold PLP-dependent enzyme [Candidatus Thorarchaeota archaeon]